MKARPSRVFPGSIFFFYFFTFSQAATGYRTSRTITRSPPCDNPSDSYRSSGTVSVTYYLLLNLSGFYLKKARLIDEFYFSRP